MLNSKSLELNVNDVWALVKGAALVGTAAVLTYIAENLTKVDLGANGVFLVPVVTVLLDTAIKWLRDNTKNVK